MSLFNRLPHWIGKLVLIWCVFLALHTPAFCENRVAPMPKGVNWKTAFSSPIPGGRTAKDGKKFWVKLCEKTTSTAEPHKQFKVCITHHEQLESKTGMLLVSVAIRQIDGRKKKALMAMVPLGMQNKPGIMAKFDNGVPVKLPITLCTSIGCAGEIEIPDEAIEKMKKAQNLAVAFINTAGKTVAFKVPMQGFEEVYNGPAADNETYKQQRRRVIEEIHRQQESDSLWPW